MASGNGACKRTAASPVRVANGDAAKSPDQVLIESCPLCMAHFAENPWALREAFASVGIEHNKSSAQMAASYFSVLHKKEGHSG